MSALFFHRRCYVQALHHPYVELPDIMLPLHVRTAPLHGLWAASRVGDAVRITFASQQGHRVLDWGDHDPASSVGNRCSSCRLSACDGVCTCDATPGIRDANRPFPRRGQNVEQTSPLS